jgi:hypothetical protein
MLLALLFLAIYIPRRATRNFAVTLSTFDALADLSATNTSLAVMAVRGTSDPLVETFLHAQALFPHARLLTSLTPDARSFLGAPHPPSPFLIISAGQFKTAIGPIDRAPALAAALALHLGPPPAPVRSRADALSAVNASPLTVFTRSSDFGKGLRFAGDFAASLGVVNVLRLGDSVVRDFEMADGECGLFRRVDSVFVRFECTADNFRAAARPTFAIAGRKFMKSADEIVVLHVNVTDGNVTAMLAELGAEFTRFTFLVAEMSQTAKVAKFLNNGFGSDAVNVAVVNFSGLYWFDTAKYISGSNDFALFAKQLRLLLKGIEDGIVPKIYRSEPVPNATPGLMPEVVGSNFAAFIKNATQDVLVYFFTFPCNECQEPLRKLWRFVEHMKSMGNEDFLVTTIHIGLNQIPGGFPVTRAPAIALYPAVNKDGVRVLPAESFRLLLWFTAKYGTRSHGIPVNLTRPAKIERIVASATKMEPHLKPEVAERLRETIRDFREDFGGRTRESL